MHRSRLSRIVVRRAGAPVTAFGPAPGRCAADPADRERADVVWRVRSAAKAPVAEPALAAAGASGA